MNSAFWLIISSMLLVAVGIVVVPLWRRNSSLDEDHKQRNIVIARQRLADLEHQREQGMLSDADFDEQYNELKLLLSDDLALESKGREIAGQGRWITPILITVIPVLSLYLYFALGDVDAQSKAEMQQNAEQTTANIGVMVGKLAAKLQQNPEDTEGWLMLGRSYSYLQQHDKAAQAFGELYRRKPHDVEATLQYANSLALASDGRVSGEPERLINEVLHADPNNPNGLWLAGMAKVEQGNMNDAASLWRRLLPLLPPDSESLQQVEAMLQSVENQLAENASTVSSATITVKVDVDSSVKKSVGPDKTVFVYAQAVDGPKMPLAIVRKKVADLPTEIVLNDAAAMQATTHLAYFAKLRIVARISQSGQASPGSGDWLGSVELAQPFGNQPVTVLINQEIK